MHALLGRWAADVRPAAPGAGAEAVAGLGRDLMERWAEPQRSYHDVTHLVEVLSAVDTLCRAERVRGRPRHVALLAAWFHDAVYVVDAPDNEARSATLARERLGSIGAKPTLVDDIVTAILDTVDHAPAPDDVGPARTVLHDADLWILAAPTPRFDEYCAQVREEYHHVPVADYAGARSAVLRPFLVRDHVYRTPHARQEWEPLAHENLARELTRLAG